MPDGHLKSENARSGPTTMINGTGKLLVMPTKAAAIYRQELNELNLLRQKLDEWRKEINGLEKLYRRKRDEISRGLLAGAEIR